MECDINFTTEEVCLQNLIDDSASQSSISLESKVDKVWVHKIFEKECMDGVGVIHDMRKRVMIGGAIE